MADIGVELNEQTVSNDLHHDTQGSRKLPSLSWKQRVIGFGITAGLAALFAILVSQYKLYNYMYSCLLPWLYPITSIHNNIVLVIHYQECFSECTCLNFFFSSLTHSTLFFSQGCALVLLSLTAFGLLFTIGSIAGVIR